jgi:Mn-dependent DtxR family transcriptional regulator
LYESGGKCGIEREQRPHESYVTLSRFFRSVLVLDLDGHEREATEMAGILDSVVTERLAATLAIDETGSAPG